jgi:hypothetical protein
MPGLHVAWALWCPLALCPVVRNRILRVLFVAYPAMTTLAVVTTGNPFVLDAVAGAVLAGMTWMTTTKVSTILARRVVTFGT